MTRTAFLTTLVSFFFVTPLFSNSYGFVSGGSGKIFLAPDEISFQTGTTQSVNLVVNSNGQAISGVAARINVPGATDIEVVKISPASIPGWTFPVMHASPEENQLTIDILALNTSTSGYATTSDTTLVSIEMRSLTAFSNKQANFDQTKTKMLKKSDAGDIVGTLGTVSLSAQGTSATQVNDPPPQQFESETTEPPTGGFGSILNQQPPPPPPNETVIQNQPNELQTENSQLDQNLIAQNRTDPPVITTEPETIQQKNQFAGVSQSNWATVAVLAALVIVAGLIYLKLFQKRKTKPSWIPPENNPPPPPKV